MFLSLWVIFQYVIKGADPRALTNCSHDEMADEIHPEREKRASERGCSSSLMGGEPRQHIWIPMPDFTFKGCILHWKCFVKVHSGWGERGGDKNAGEKKKKRKAKWKEDVLNAQINTGEIVLFGGRTSISEAVYFFCGACLLKFNYMWHFSVAIKVVHCCEGSYSVSKYSHCGPYQNAANARLACKRTFCVRALNIVPSPGECLFNNIIPMIRMQPPLPLGDKTLIALLITLTAPLVVDGLASRVISNSARVDLEYTKIRSYPSTLAFCPCRRRRSPQ